MRVSVFGLGYVGVVMAACLARAGHTVVGVDVQDEKVRTIAAGRSPILEPGLQELLSEAVRAGRLTATGDADAAVRDTDLSVVSVGTPSAEDGNPNLAHVLAVAEQIGRAVARKGEDHVFVLRSTVPPGTLACCRARIEAAADGVPVHVAFNPEFLREGSAIADFDAPAYTVVGTDDAVAEEALRTLYREVQAPFLVVEPEVAEMVKYAANAWHATKIAFANEIGRVARAAGVDGRDVMDLIRRDTKLNASGAYMKPGFAFGGSCLPKDLRALQGMARGRNVEVPLLEAVTRSNTSMVEEACRVLRNGAPRRVAVLGLAFKPGTDDLRESPSVTLVKWLIGEGYEVAIYDEAVRPDRLLGSNLDYIRSNLPHFEGLLTTDLAGALERSQVAVVAHATDSFREPLLRAHDGLEIVDVAGLFDAAPADRSYRGLGW